uniref:Trypsin I-P1 n=1 Tax=Bactrocera dorsalis TaxID=27457 RepID=A0A034VZS7_BACDO
MDFQGFFWYFIYTCLAFQVAQSTALAHLKTPLENQPSSEAKIINGTEALWDGTRYQVSLRLTAGDWLFGAGHICGGALISRRSVLTAAHCIWMPANNRFRNASDLSVVVGNLNRYQRDNNTLVLGVSKISVHRDYNATSYTNDVAVLHLDGHVPANFTRARAIPLNSDLNLNASNTVCQVSGWGRTENGGYSPQLMVVDVAIVNRSQCATNYGALVHDGMICAGYMEGGRDACVGDSGGPLVCGEQLAGVVSFGVGCAQPGFPGVYTDVATYVPWINNVTKSYEDAGGLSDDGLSNGGVVGANGGTNDSTSNNGTVSNSGVSMMSCAPAFIFTVCLLLMQVC